MRLITIVSVALCVLAACNAAPTNYETEGQLILRNDVDLYGWTDYLEQITATISNVIESAKKTGGDLWQGLREAGNQIIQKAKDSLVSSEDAAQVFLQKVYPTLITQLSTAVDFGKDELRFIGDLVVQFLKDFGQEAIRLGIKYFEEHKDEIIEEITIEAKVFLRAYILKKLRDLWVGGASLKRELIAPYGWSDFWEKVGKAIDNAVHKVEETGHDLADKISDEFDEIKDKVNAIIAPVKTKVQVILRDVMPVIAAKAKIVIHDARELAIQVGKATLEILKKLGHDALLEAQKWLEKNHELVEKLLFKFLTEQLPKLILDSVSSYSVTTYNGWTDFWEKVGEKIDSAIAKVKETGEKLADKITEEFDEMKDKINAIVAPIKVKVQIILRDVMPKIAAKAKIVIHDAQELAKQVGTATLQILKKLGHDALVEAKKWLEANHELVEKLLFKFLTEQLPKLIMDSMAESSMNSSVTTYGWSDFWEKVGDAIEKAVDKVKATGDKLADKISQEFDELKEKINGIVAPVKAKVQIILRDIMPKIAAKAKIIIHDAAELARQVGTATLKILKKLGHDALVEAQKWLEKNHELVEKLLFKFLTEQLPKMIMDSLNSYSVSTYNGWTDFWEKVGQKIDSAIAKVKETGEDLADKIVEEFDELKDKINAIVAPIKIKVQIILRDLMPKLAAKAKIVIHDARELAKQVGTAVLQILKKLGHDALVEAKKWLEANHELVEKLLFKFLTEQLPKLIKDSMAESYSLAVPYNGWTDFWDKVGKAIDNAVDKVKETGHDLADKISDEFDEIKDKVNAIIAPIKTKVQIIMRDVMPVIAAKAKIVIHDAKQLAIQVGKATLEILKKLGHDALVEAQKWLEKNHELVEKLLFKFLTEQLPKLIMDSIKSYSVATYNGWTDFWEKVGKAIEKAVDKVKATGDKLADKISDEFDELKEKINGIVAPVKAKVEIILRDLMPKIAAKAKIIIHDGGELAKQVGTATLKILKKLGHDALVEAQKWLEKNHELVEKLLFKFLTEQLPKMIMDSASSY